MTKRAKVLRDPHFGPGLLMVEGRQYPFQMDGSWRSQAPAKPGLLVDVEFDDDGSITSIAPVTESQLACERSQTWQSHGKAQMPLLRWSKAIPSTDLIPALVVVALICSWYLLPAISMRSSLLGTVHFTFWQVLRQLNSNRQLPGATAAGISSAGLYGVVALVAAAGPLLPLWVRDRRAGLANLLPAVFTVAIVVLIRFDVHGFVGAVYPVGLPEEFMRSVTLGPGAYLSLLIALYLTAATTKKVLRPRIRSETNLAGPERAAA